MKQLRKLRLKRLHHSRISQPSWHRIWCPRICLEDKHISRSPVYLWLIGSYGGGRQGTHTSQAHPAPIVRHHVSAGDLYISPFTLQHAHFQKTMNIHNIPDSRATAHWDPSGNVQGVHQTHSLFKQGGHPPWWQTRRKQLWIPAITLLHCWNHIFTGIRALSQKHGAPAVGITAYCDDEQQRFHSTTEEDYEENWGMAEDMGCTIWGLLLERDPLWCVSVNWEMGSGKAQCIYPL